jgi:hypothetical protein
VFAGVAALAAASAHADYVDITAINAGKISGPSTLSIGASVSATSTAAEFVSSSGVDIDTGQNGVGSGINVFTYNFKLGSGFNANSAPPELSLAFNGGTGLSYIPQGANVVLFDTTTGKALDTVAGTGGSLSLTANLWDANTGAAHIGDTFQIALYLPASFKGTILGLGNVPLPGALLLFGSALAGLGAVGARRRKAGTAA